MWSGFGSARTIRTVTWDDLDRANVEPLDASTVTSADLSDSLLVAVTYWVGVAVQRYRNQTDESSENFENKNSLGLPFTSRW